MILPVSDIHGSSGPDRQADVDAYDCRYLGFFVAYSKASGGIFIDCGIHDIDMARWLLSTPGSDCAVKRVFATGQNVRHPELEKDGDADNALAIIDFRGGQRVTFHLSRTAIHGHDCHAEIFGTEGKMIVNGVRFCLI